MSERNPLPNSFPANDTSNQQPSIQQQLPAKPLKTARGDSRDMPVLFVETLGLEDLLERAELDLEASFWPSAAAYSDRALALDPGNARAYLYKLMADVKVTKPEQLKNLKHPFDEHPCYQKIMQLEDDGIKEALLASNQYICDHLSSLYQSELDQVRHALTYAVFVPDVNKAETLLEPVPSFPASDQLREECRRKKQELFAATLAQAETDAREFRWADAVRLLESISGDEKCRVRLLEYKRMLEIDQRYGQGVAYQEKNLFREAAEIFAGLENYRDSALRLKKCRRMIRGNKVRAVGKEHTKAVVCNVLLSAFLALGCTISAPSFILLNFLWGIPLTIFSVVMTILRARYRPAKRMWIVMAAVFGLFLVLTATGILPFGQSTESLPSILYLIMMLGTIFI